MAGENIANVADANQGESDARQRSSIAFPYNNLGDALEVAQAIHSHTGTGDCDDGQLSAWMNLSPKSSGYRIQVSAARMFGLVETSSGRHKLAPLGLNIVDPQQERGARAQAFLCVPLYKAMYEKYKTGVLPPAAALERDIVGLGVAEKQKERARQVFERSAEQAGFFEHGKNRLVMPAVAIKSEAVAPPPPADTVREDHNGERKHGSGGPPSGLHPFIQGLLQTLPPPESEWDAKDRAKWLQTAANIFELIYKGEGGGIAVTAARADRSPRPGEH